MEYAGPANGRCTKHQSI